LKSEFVPVAEVNSVKIFSKKTGFISFFNSPYPSHKELAAIDVYEFGADFGDIAYSPVNGEVLFTNENESPTLFKNKIKKDYLVFIKSINPALYVKVLHIKPSIKPAKKIKVGSKIGRFIRSGYFAFWNDPGMHIEVRRSPDDFKALGGVEITPLLDGKSIFHNANNESISGAVFKKNSRYTLMKCDQEVFGKIGNFYGLAAKINGSDCIIDGGLPFNEYVGVISNRALKTGENLTFCDIIVGKTVKTFGNTALVKCKKINFYAEDEKFRGLSLYLFLKTHNLIKLVPLKVGGLNFKTNENITLRLKSG
jgi:hypothetical protein